MIPSPRSPRRPSCDPYLPCWRPRSPSPPGEIAAALAAEGHELSRLETADGGSDITAIRDGARVDLTLDAATGAVIALHDGQRRGAPDRPGVSDQAIRARLEAEGYTITKYERERDEIEVYATRAGAHFKIKSIP